MTDSEDFEKLLSAAVNAYRALPKGIPVSLAIQAMTSFKIIALDLQSVDDMDLLRRISDAATHCMRASQLNPVKSARVNEVGNLLEPLLKISLETQMLNVSWPTTAGGASGRSGYPDLLVTESPDRLTYIEVKAVGPGQESSTFRSFYLSPSDTPKVVADARHLLVAFGHKHVGTAEDGAGLYQMTHFKVVDLAHVVGQIKFEYQTSNRGLYNAGAVKSSG